MLAKAMDISPQGIHHIKTLVCLSLIWLCECLLKVFFLCWNTCVVEQMSNFTLTLNRDLEEVLEPSLSFS
jgi:hypothetical protein